MQNIVIWKNLPVKDLKDFAAGVYWSEAQYPAPPFKTLYTCLQYTYSQGRGVESWTREKVRGAIVHKAGSKIPTWLTVSPVYKTLINTCRKVPFQINFFRCRHFALVSLPLISPWMTPTNRWSKNFELKRGLVAIPPPLTPSWDYLSMTIIAFLVASSLED